MTKVKTKVNPKNLPKVVVVDEVTPSTTQPAHIVISTKEGTMAANNVIETAYVETARILIRSKNNEDGLTREDTAKMKMWADILVSFSKEEREARSMSEFENMTLEQLAEIIKKSEEKGS